MPTDILTPDAIHFKSIRLGDVRAFASPQCLEFTDENGAVSRWNLILGENGVGKTTLLQALAVMRPVPAFDEPITGKSDDAEKADDDGTPRLVEAEFSAHANEEIRRFIRRNGTRTMKIGAELVDTETGMGLSVSAEITGHAKDLISAEFPKFRHQLRSRGPLVIGYGAGRHIGDHNLDEVAARSTTQSLFSGAIDLYDAAVLIEKLDYAAQIDKAGKDLGRLEMLKTAVASLLPGDLTVKDIDVRGPMIEGRDPDRSGVFVRTPSGMTPLTDLSIGNQAMFALTVDLAWRLFNAFPESDTPLSESAIVLIDEVDLHAHPRWQRNLRRNFLEQFPKVQFIVTTHNPVIAQEALSEGGTVAVVRVLAQRENEDRKWVEEGRFRPAGGDFQGIGVYRSDRGSCG